MGFIISLICTISIICLKKLKEYYSIDFGNNNHDILMTILFHDVIYDGKQKKITKKNQRSPISTFQKLKIFMILETKDHFTINIPENIDKDIFLKCRNWFVGLI